MIVFRLNSWKHPEAIDSDTIEIRAEDRDLILSEGGYFIAFPADAFVIKLLVTQALDQLITQAGDILTE